MSRRAACLPTRSTARSWRTGSIRPDSPDPDLILRPSGEQRLSNFLIWQSAYAEYVFQDILWPDYTPAALDEALREYAKRHRRFGGI